MQYSSNHLYDRHRRDEVKVAVLADSLREESPAQQWIQDLLVAAAAIASCTAMYALIN